MKDLSYIQEYYICVINKNGNLPVLNYLSAAVCLGVGELMELAGYGCLARDDKGMISVAKPYEGSLPYLMPIYETLARKKEPVDIENVLFVYMPDVDILTLTIWDIPVTKTKPLSDLLTPIGESLTAAGYASKITPPDSKKPKYAPKPEAVERIIEKIRAAFLGVSGIPAETLYLTALLEKSGVLSSFFDKHEISAIISLIEESRKSGTDTSVKEILGYTDAIPRIAAKLGCGG